MSGFRQYKNVRYYYFRDLPFSRPKLFGGVSVVLIDNFEARVLPLPWYDLEPIGQMKKSFVVPPLRLCRRLTSARQHQRIAEIFLTFLF